MAINRNLSVFFIMSAHSLPYCHDDSLGRANWVQGIGEWEVIQSFETVQAKQNRASDKTRNNLCGLMDIQGKSDQLSKSCLFERHFFRPGLQGGISPFLRMPEDTDTRMFVRDESSLGGQ